VEKQIRLGLGIPEEAPGLGRIPEEAPGLGILMFASMQEVRKLLVGENQYVYIDIAMALIIQVLILGIVILVVMILEEPVGNQLKILNHNTVLRTSICVILPTIKLHVSGFRVFMCQLRQEEQTIPQVVPMRRSIN